LKLVTPITRGVFCPATVQRISSKRTRTTFAPGVVVSPILTCPVTVTVAAAGAAARETKSNHETIPRITRINADLFMHLPP
jgi:hypothetical protein